MPPPSIIIVTLIDVEHVMDGTTVRLTFYYQHDDNLTGTTVVPVMMDPTCEEIITSDETDMMGGGGVRLEPVWIDAMHGAAMLIGQASVDLPTASDGIWTAPGAGATEAAATTTTAAEAAIGTLRFCYGLDIYRSTTTTSGRAEDEQQVLVHAVRTKFTVRVNFVVVFGEGGGGEGGDGTDKSKDSLSSEIETEEQEDDPKLAVYLCSEHDDDEQDWLSATTDDFVVTVCVESRDASNWTIDNVLESSLRVSGVSAGIEDETSVRVVSSASSSVNQTFSTALVQEDEPPVPSWRLISLSCHHQDAAPAEAATATTCRIQIAISSEAAATSTTAIFTLRGTATLVSTRNGERETHDFGIGITDHRPARYRNNNNSAAAQRLGSATDRVVTFLLVVVI